MVTADCTRQLVFLGTSQAKGLPFDDPQHDDAKIDEMLEGARLLALESGKALEVEAAQEGAELWLNAR